MGGGEVFRDRYFLKRGLKVFSMELNFSGGGEVITCYGIDIVSRERVLFFMVVETFSMGEVFSCGLKFFGGGEERVNVFFPVG